ncbi:MAG: hypothetical protein ACYDAR_19755 [Thermomicrobiales bacterium]
MLVNRLPENPIIHSGLDTRIGTNVNGPSVIRVPDWLPHPLGRYYCYFAHHEGTYIRLAYADDIAGPWTIYAPGVLDLKGAFFAEHIASPDVHVNHDTRQIRMYYHGAPLPDPPYQFTRVALSEDGLHFIARPEILGVWYWRGFRWREMHYGLAMPGRFYRSADPLTDFAAGPTLFTSNMRHSTLALAEDTLHIYYTNVGDCPERILCASIALGDDWQKWEVTTPVVVLEPEEPYEGAMLPLVPSARGAIYEPARQLRDPYIFADDGRTWLFYAAAGEQGIAVAELSDRP